MSPNAKTDDMQSCQVIKVSTSCSSSQHCRWMTSGPPGLQSAHTWVDFISAGVLDEAYSSMQLQAMWKPAKYQPTICYCHYLQQYTLVLLECPPQPPLASHHMFICTSVIVPSFKHRFPRSVIRSIISPSAGKRTLGLVSGLRFISFIEIELPQFLTQDIVCRRLDLMLSIFTADINSPIMSWLIASVSLN